MARQVALVEREDFASDQDSLSLLSYTDGFCVEDYSWVNSIPENIGGSVDDAMKLLVRSTSDNNLASIMQELTQKRRVAAQYKSGHDRYGVWLRAQLENESYARQAYIEALRYTPPSFARPNRNDLFGLTLGFRRGPWEDTAYTQFSGSSLHSIGGTFTVNNAGGDIPARLALTNFAPTGTYQFRYWLGLRSPRFGTPANFQPYWIIHYSSLVNVYDVSTQADTNARDGSAWQCTFATHEEMQPRAKVKCDAVATYPDDQRGRFQVLLRARLSASSTVVRIRRITAKLENYTTPAFGPRITITDTDYRYYDLGVISIPGSRLYNGNESIDDTYIGIAAERISGAGYLNMDCFVLIPIDEGFVFADTSIANSANEIAVIQYPDGRVNGYQVSSGDIGGDATVKVSGGVPVGSGIAVVASEREDITVKTDTIDVDLYAYQRWESLRGNDT